jgi:hypothetical protein
MNVDNSNAGIGNKVNNATREYGNDATDFTCLTKQVLEHVLSFLPETYFVSLSLTCKHCLHELADGTEIYWHGVLERKKWPYIQVDSDEHIHSVPSRRVYMVHHSIVKHAKAIQKAYKALCTELLRSKGGDPWATAPDGEESLDSIDDNICFWSSNQILTSRRGSSFLRLHEFSDTSQCFSTKIKEIARLTMDFEEIFNCKDCTVVDLVIDNKYIVCALYINEEELNLSDVCLITMLRGDFFLHCKDRGGTSDAVNSTPFWCITDLHDLLLDSISTRNDCHDIMVPIQQYIAAGSKEGRVKVGLPGSICVCGNGLFASLVSFKIPYTGDMGYTDYKDVGTVVMIYSAITNSVLWIGQCQQIVSNKHRIYCHLQMESKIIGDLTLIAARCGHAPTVMLIEVPFKTFKKGDSLDVRYLRSECHDDMERWAVVDSLMILDKYLVTVDGMVSSVDAAEDEDDSESEMDQDGEDFVSLSFYKHSERESTSTQTLFTTTPYSRVIGALPLGGSHIGLLCLDSNGEYIKDEPSISFDMFSSFELIVLHAGTGLEICRYTLEGDMNDFMGHKPSVFSDSKTLALTLSNGMIALSSPKMQENSYARMC